MTTENVRLEVRLPAELREALDQAAAARYQSVASYVRQAVQERLARDARTAMERAGQ